MKGINKLIYSWIDRKFLSGCSSYNSLEVRKSCRSKLQARTVFAANGIPHARGTVFFWPWTAFKFAKLVGFPLVVKPNVSGFSRGSYFPITSYRELLKAALLAKVWWPVSVVEMYLEGKNYRITAVKGELMSVIQRYPPFVEGDGSSTISELIDKENMTREEMGLYPVVYPIAKDYRIRKYLKKSGKSMTTVPNRGERVLLLNRITLVSGGVVETIDKETLHPDNTELFEMVLERFGANILGIDAIFAKGIEISYKKQKTILLEVNSRPYLKMHDVPRYGKKEDLRRYYDKLNQLKVEETDSY